MSNKSTTIRIRASDKRLLDQLCKRTKRAKTDMLSLIIRREHETQKHHTTRTRLKAG